MHNEPSNGLVSLSQQRQAKYSVVSICGEQGIIRNPEHPGFLMMCSWVIYL